MSPASRREFIKIISAVAVSGTSFSSPGASVNYQWSQSASHGGCF
jgi:hypothetical protein